MEIFRTSTATPRLFETGSEPGPSSSAGYSGIDNVVSPMESPVLSPAAHEIATESEHEGVGAKLFTPKVKRGR